MYQSPLTNSKNKAHICNICEKRTQEEAKHNVILVQNELLSYAVYYMQSCTYEAVEKTVLYTCDLDDICEAKYFGNITNSI